MPKLTLIPSKWRCLVLHMLMQYPTGAYIPAGRCAGVLRELDHYSSFQP